MDLIELNITHLTEIDVTRLHLMNCFRNKNDPFMIHELNKNEFLIRNKGKDIEVIDFQERLIKEKLSKEAQSFFLHFWDNTLLLSISGKILDRFPVFKHHNY